MSGDRDERRPGRRPRGLADAGQKTGSESRIRRLKLLGLVNSGAFLAALVFYLLSLPPPSPGRLAALGVILGCIGIALLLRRRFWMALEGELERRKRAEQEARAADHAKSRFLANVSHEIRTPMNGILGMTDLLLRSGLTQEQHEQVALVKTSAEALLALVDDVLDLSRIEAERLLLRPQDFKLRELAGEVVRLLTPRAAEREVDLRLRVAPAVADDLHGDAVRLRQVLLNLVGNAIRFTRKGSVTITVEPDEEDEAGAVLRFEVRDTGVGIRPEDQARLFEPFTQGEGSGSGKFSGTGLGLVISRSIVELMGGEIGFESARGKGSTFWFRLPLVRALGSGDPSRTPAPDIAEADRRLARRDRRILVVDDRSANLAVALALLRELGFAAEAVESGEEALAALAERPFHAVLLDCEMPGLDGFETCRRLREQEAAGRLPRLPVIAVTAHTQPEEREACRTAGMDTYLAKPFRTAELAAELDRWLGIEATAARPGSERPEPAADDLAERLAALKSLEEKTGKSVVAIFLQQGEEDVATLRRALPQEDRKAIAEAAHALAGSAGMLGITGLAEKAAVIANLARQGDVSGCAAHLPALEQAWRETTKRLAP